MDILVRPVADQAGNPGWGKTTWVESIEQQLGGNGANTAYALARLGIPSRLLSAVGEDTLGVGVIEILNAAGVETRWIERSAGPTATTVVLVRADGERALLHRPAASREAFSSGIDLESGVAAGCSRFHLANVFALERLQPHAADLLRRAKAGGMSTSLDTGWDAQGRWMATLGDCLPHAGLLFVNEDEARQLGGTEDIKAAVGILQSHGASDVIVKLGAEGCLVCAGSEHFRVAAFDVPAVDTTGAGDCFAGGFLAALQRGYAYREAARFANAVGALSVQALGGVTGLRSFEETLRWMGAPAGRNAWSTPIS